MSQPISRLAIASGPRTAAATRPLMILDVDAERLKTAPGFDKDHWPDMAGSAGATDVHAYYGTDDELPPN